MEAYIHSTHIRRLAMKSQWFLQWIKGLVIVCTSCGLVFLMIYLNIRYHGVLGRNSRNMSGSVHHGTAFAKPYAPQRKHFKLGLLEERSNQFEVCLFRQGHHICMNHEHRRQDKSSMNTEHIWYYWCVLIPFFLCIQMMFKWIRTNSENPIVQFFLALWHWCDISAVDSQSISTRSNCDIQHTYVARMTCNIAAFSKAWYLVYLV